MKYTIVIPPLVEKTVRILPPSLKNQIRAGLEAIQENPHIGKPLKDELRGLWSYRVSRYRIVYRIEHRRIEIQVIDLGSRAVIYDRILQWVRRLS
ncbi:MAG: type II toxin-antitoxin system RelE/ParE family toxin [Candidatus Omnitrophica bacterium]|nr:type II toxin-antitoxin system RelE/ParE family toxin [Candidatus Omnitrophota bacterium]